MSSRPVGRLLELEYRILELAQAAPSSNPTVYGFQLARDLSTGPNDSLIGHGTLYKALGRLSAMGMLDWHWEPDDASDATRRPRRRLYAITGAGARALHARPTVASSSSMTIRPVTA